MLRCVFHSLTFLPASAGGRGGWGGAFAFAILALWLVWPNRAAAVCASFVFLCIALFSCLSKAFETILNRKFVKHLSSFNLLSDYQYGFRKERSTGDLLGFLTESWSSSLNRFGKVFDVTLDISKAFDRVWNKALLSKLHSYGVYPSLCSFLSSFLSGRSISAVVYGHCSTSKPINSSVPQGTVLSPTLFLLFINDLLSLTNCPIHSYADDTNLHYST